MPPIHDSPGGNLIWYFRVRPKFLNMDKGHAIPHSAKVLLGSSTAKTMYRLNLLAENR
jgi:hypothetical protein